MFFKNGGDLMSWLQDAMGDVADCEIQMMREETAKIVNELNKFGCEDIKGALADRLYNNVDTLVDLIGDQIYGLPNRKEILDDCIEHGHTALIEACTRLQR